MDTELLGEIDSIADLKKQLIFSTHRIKYDPASNKMSGFS